MHIPMAALRFMIPLSRSYTSAMAMGVRPMASFVPQIHRMIRRNMPQKNGSLYNQEDVLQKPDGESNLRSPLWNKNNNAIFMALVRTSLCQKPMWSYETWSSTGWPWRFYGSGLCCGFLDCYCFLSKPWRFLSVNGWYSAKYVRIRYIHLLIVKNKK